MRRVAKALVAAAVAGLSIAVPLVDDGVSWGDALGIALAALAAYQAVYWTPWIPGTTSTPRPATPPE